MILKSIKRWIVRREEPALQPEDGRLGEVTSLLGKWSEPAARERLLEIVYPELRRLAQSRMRRERNDHTLEPTALVHEVYLQLAKQGELHWRNRAHFLAVASEAMRRILVDYARAHNASKRGGESAKVELTQAEAIAREPFTVVLEIHHLLEELARTDERMSRIVELRYFGGLSHDEVGEVLGTSARTVKRDWEVARAWLFTRMHRGKPSDAGTVATA